MLKKWVHTIALASVIETFSNFPNTTFPLLIETTLGEDTLDHWFPILALENPCTHASLWNN